MRVRAAGINFLDVLIRRGRYPQMPELPAVLGVEIAGELEDGTRVMAIVPAAAAYAELAAVTARLARAAARRRDVRRGRGFPPHLPDRVRPADAAGALRGGAVGARARRGGRRRHAPRSRSRARSTRRVIAAVGSPREARALPQARRRGGVRLRRAARTTCGSTSSSTRSAASSSTRPFARLRPLGQLVAIGFAGGLVAELQPAQLVGPQRRRAGRLHRPAAPPRARRDRSCDARAARALAAGAQDRPLVGAEFPLDEVERGARARRVAPSVGKVVLVP